MILLGQHSGFYKLMKMLHLYPEKGQFPYWPEFLLTHETDKGTTLREHSINQSFMWCNIIKAFIQFVSPLTTINIFPFHHIIKLHFNNHGILQINPNTGCPSLYIQGSEVKTLASDGLAAVAVHPGVKGHLAWDQSHLVGNQGHLVRDQSHWVWDQSRFIESGIRVSFPGFTWPAGH